MIEAREEEESSPKLPKGLRSPTRNNDANTNALNKHKMNRHQGFLSDVDKFEKISDDA